MQGGDYASNASFKGYATPAGALACCQPLARSNSSPPLDQSCWTSKPGQSFPPLSAHQYIGVIVSTSIVKSGSTIYGNIAALAILDVDPNPPQGPNPGHPGWGTLVAIIEDCASLFPPRAQLLATQSQPATSLPSQPLTVTLQLSNPSSTPATSVTVSESFSGLSPSSAQKTAGTVTMGAPTVIQFAETALAVPTRQPNETSAAYQARLGSVDGQLLTSNATVTFSDGFGQPYPPVLAAASSVLELPRLALSVAAPACVGPGSRISYALSVTNVGSAAAATATIQVSFPDGTTAFASTASLAPGASYSTSLDWTVPVPAAAGANESVTDYLARLALSDGQGLVATARLSWTDAAGGSYGTLEQSASSIERLPVLSTTPPPSAGAMLPGQTQSLSFGVHNTGSGNAFQALLGLSNPDGSSSSAAPFSLGGGQSTSVYVWSKAPAIAPKISGESDAVYLARLHAADTATIQFGWSLGWLDAAGDSYGPTRGSLSGTEVLPVLELSLSGPPTALPGATVSYQVSASNSGHATCTGTVALSFSDGSGASAALGPAPGQSQAASLSWQLPALSPIGQNESTAAYLGRLGGIDGKQLSTSASLDWIDGVGNQYGPVEKSTSLLEQVPILGVTQQQQQSVLLPGEMASIGLLVGNSGSADAQQAILGLSNADGSAAAPQPAFAVLAGQNQALTVSAAAAPLAPRSGSETDSAYLARLAALDGSSIAFAWTLGWQDAGGSLYGPTRGSLGAQQALPVVAVTLGGPAAANAGDTITYALGAQNSGHAGASGLVLTVTLPDGSTSLHSIGSLGAGAASELSVPFQVPVSYPSGPITATVSWTWTDAAGNSYGPVTASFATQVTNPNQPPTVSAGPSQTIALPATTVTLAGSVSDDGLPAGGALTSLWSRVSGPAPVVFANPALPVTTASFSAPGLYVLRLTASDSMFSSSADVTIIVKLPSGPVPTVALSSPADGAELTSPTDIVGSVSGGLWQVEYIAGGEESGAAPVTLCSGYTPLANAKLCSFDPTVLLNGTYAIRLTAATDQGQSAVSLAAAVTRNLKVGLFTLAWSDLTVPVAGLPIQVVRTYDSRDKSQGDFGVGWNVSVRNVRVQKSAGLGKHWAQTQIWDFIPSYCLFPTRSLFVTITFPTGKVYRFQAGTYPDCQPMFPITDGALTFSPVAPTQGSLTASNVDFMVQGTMGPVQLTDFSMGGPLNPTVFQLTAEDGTVYVIDEKLGVTSQKDRNGNTLEIGPSGIIHSSGKSVTFTRDGQGRISKITDPAGKELTYSYDAAGNLASSTDRTGNVTTYSYNATHGLLTVVDPRGVQAQKNVYDSDGRLVSITDANGKTISYTHNLSARQEVVTDRLGGVTVLEYDTNGNIVQETDSLGGVTTRTFDARDNLLTETNPLGKTTTNTYDGADQLPSTTDPLGNKTSYTYAAFRKVATTTDPLGHVTTNSYDGGGNLLSTTDAAGKTTSYTYDLQGLPLTRTDRNGKVTSFEYDGAGNLTKQTDVLGNATSFTYDTLGRKLTSTRSRTGPLGPETLTTTWEYDAQGRQTAVIYPDGSKTKTTYNAFGKPATTVDQLNRSTSYTYDQRGQLSTTTYPDGTSESITYDDEGRETSRTDRGGRTTSYERDALGRLTKTAYADGSTRKSGYDSAGREMSSTDELGNTTTYGFDAAGRRTTVTDPLGNVTATGYDAEGNAVTVTDANGHTTTTSYDPENRPIKVTYADGTFSSTAYDNEGRRTSQTDAAGITTSFGYDAVGQLVQVTDALGSITKYGYDELGNRISQTDANNHTTSFEYDKLGRRTKRILPLGQVETLGYDAAGNLTSRTDFNGKTTSYTFDSSNRLLSKTPDASFGAAAVSFTYTPAGRRASMVDGTGTASYTYDVRDRLLRKATPFGTLTMSYDLAGGRLTLRSDKPDGVSVDYGWDAARRLSSVTDKSAGGGATSYSYNLAGNLVGYEYPNGVKVTLTRDALDRVKKLAALDPSNQPLASYEYTFGPAGNRTSLTELSGRTVTWSYDNLYRLTKETVAGGSVNGSISYTLDAVGNRLTRSSTVPPIPSATSSCDANDRLFSDTYDAEGSTTAAGANSYSYDFEARLSAFNASQVTLVYDGDGHLVSRTVGGATTTYLVDEGNPTGYTQVAEERVGGAVNKALVFGLQLISQRQMVSGAWTRSYYGFDGHGHVRYLTDASGAVADTYDFDAFGSPLSSTGGTPNDYRYVGERWDSNLGLVYLRARYLDGSKGRFVTADPAEGVSTTPLSLNRYSYADADPVNRRDPLGTWSTAAWGIVIHGIIGRQFVEGNPNTRRSNRWLSTVVGTALEIDGSLAADIGADARLRPDLVDLATNEVYEIKPAGSEREGWAQLDSYIALLNHYTWPLWGQSRWRRGTSWHYKPLETWIPIPLTYVDYLVHATDNGLIVYDVSRERLYRLYRAVLYEYMVGALLTRLLSLPSLARLAL